MSEPIGPGVAGRGARTRTAARVLVVTGLVALASVAAATDDADDLDRLVTWMSGSFSSARQAADHPTFLDVRLHMTPIWRDRDDGRWLYVEQAVAAAPDRPYRQRVYHVTRGEDGAYRSAVYEIPEPELYVGAWGNPETLDDLAPEALRPREGCTVVLWPEGDVFRGSTVGRDCASTLRGAAYATSDVTVGVDRVVSWDRGFDDSGEQVWGSTAGPYELLRDEPEAPAE